MNREKWIFTIFTILIAITATSCGGSSENSRTGSVSAPAICAVEEQTESTPFANSRYEYSLGKNGLEQRDRTGNVIRSIPFSQIGIKHTWAMELVQVTDRELFYIYTDYDTPDDELMCLWSIPLHREGENEVPAVSEQERVLVGVYDLDSTQKIWATDQYISYVGLDGVYHECNRKTGKAVKISEQKEKTYSSPVGLFRWSRDVEADHILLGDYSEKIVGEKTLYLHKIGSHGTRAIEDGAVRNTVIASGDGKYFYTGLQRGTDTLSFDLWCYDCQSEEKKVLFTAEQLMKAAGAKEPNGYDLVTSLTVKDRILYIAVNADRESKWLWYNLDGSSELQAGTGSPNPNREKGLIPPLEHGNDKYIYCNDTGIYTETAGAIEQREPDGSFVGSFALEYGEMLRYVNNEELIIQKYDDVTDEKTLFYTIPLENVGGKSRPLPWKIREIEGSELKDDTVFEGNLFANADCLIFITACHEFTVFDRKAGHYIRVKHAPMANHGFSNDNNILENIGTRCAIFNSKPVNDDPDNPKYGFSLYKFGDSHVTTIDDKCYTASSYVYYDKGEKVFYVRPDKDAFDDTEALWEYDIETGERRQIVTRQTMKDICREKGLSQDSVLKSIHIWNGRLFLFGDATFSISLEGDTDLRYEQAFSEALTELKSSGYSYWDIRTIAEGNVLLCREEENEDEEDYWSEDAEFYCICDLQTGEHREVGENDPEWLYFCLTEWN